MPNEEEYEMSRNFADVSQNNNCSNRNLLGPEV